MIRLTKEQVGAHPESFSGRAHHLRNGREQMTDIDRYRQGAEYSAQMVRKVNIYEIRQIWLLIERSYRFLLQREERIVRAKSDAFAG
jgi:hypothetical protein